MDKRKRIDIRQEIEDRRRHDRQETFQFIGRANFPL